MSDSRRAPRGFRPGFPLKVILAMYVAAAALLPLGHHDIVCHLKSATHCTTCVTGSSAEPASDGAGLIRISLHASGRSLFCQPARVDSLPLTAAAGRAPPSIA